MSEDSLEQGMRIGYAIHALLDSVQKQKTILLDTKPELPLRLQHAIRDTEHTAERLARMMAHITGPKYD